MAQSLHLLGQVSVNEPSPDRSAPTSLTSGTWAQGQFGPYRPGDVIAKKYELLRVISQGGMGWVWVAHHLTLQIETAIKLIRPDLRADTVTERFINEARVAAHVEHPGIVSVFDFGVTDRATRTSSWSCSRAKSCATCCGERAPVAGRGGAAALADRGRAGDAHARGIVHRDLKPENVFLAGARAAGRAQDSRLRHRQARRAVRHGG